MKYRFATMVLLCGFLFSKASPVVQFPMITGANLEGKQFVFPKDFAGQQNLLCISFSSAQQPDVVSWYPAATRLRAQHPKLAFYEMPVLPQTTATPRAFVDTGLRSGVPDKVLPEVVIRLYYAESVFLKAIGENSNQSIILLLVNQQGDILWRGHGAFNTAQEVLLEKVLQP
jgi:hypothetical protein